MALHKVLAMSLLLSSCASGGVVDKNTNIYWANNYRYKGDLCPTSSSVYMGAAMGATMAIAAPLSAAIIVGTLVTSSIWLVNYEVYKPRIDCGAIEDDPV